MSGEWGAAHTRVRFVPCDGQGMSALLICPLMADGYFSTKPPFVPNLYWCARRKERTLTKGD
jgi:hypothetical protein